MWPWARAGDGAQLAESSEVQSEIAGSSEAHLEVAGSSEEHQHPYTPRGDPAWYSHEPSAGLVEQCLRPGHCSLAEGEERDFLHSKLLVLGHAYNERDQWLMAYSCFRCSYALTPTPFELLSTANMRYKLGQWALVEELYRRIVCMELTAPQREVRPHIRTPRRRHAPELRTRAEEHRRSVRALISY